MHLMQGSVDALQFSAIYPQISVPSITAVGYNGVLLWQHGYISGESFAGSIEKAWAGLHVQETAVITLLTVAIASKKPENLNSSSQVVAQGNSSALDTASTSAGKSTESSEDKSSDDSKLPVEQMVVKLIDDKNAGPGPETSSSDIVEDVKIEGEEKTSSKDNTSEEAVCSVSRDVLNPSTCNEVGVSTSPTERLALDESQTEASPASGGKAAVHCLNSSQTTAISKEEKANEEVSEQTE